MSRFLDNLTEALDRWDWWKGKEVPDDGTIMDMYVASPPNMPEKEVKKTALEWIERFGEVYYGEIDAFTGDEGNVALFDFVDDNPGMEHWNINMTAAPEVREQLSLITTPVKIWTGNKIGEDEYYEIPSFSTKVGELIIRMDIGTSMFGDV